MALQSMKMKKLAIYDTRRYRKPHKFEKIESFLDSNKNDDVFVPITQNSLIKLPPGKYQKTTVKDPNDGGVGGTGNGNYGNGGSGGNSGSGGNVGGNGNGNGGGRDGGNGGGNGNDNNPEDLPYYDENFFRTYPLYIMIRDRRRK